MKFQELLLSLLVQQTQEWEMMTWASSGEGLGGVGNDLTENVRQIVLESSLCKVKVFASDGKCHIDL